MDAKRCDFFVCALIFLALFLLFASQTAAGAARPYKDFVADCCKNTPDAQFCTATLLSDPKIRNAKNANDVARVGLEIGKLKTLATSNIFNGLSQQSGIDGAYKPAMQTCAAEFKDAVIFFDPRIIGSGTASLDVHNALDQCESCETVLAEAKITLESALGAVAEWKRVYNVAYDAVVASEAAGGGGE